MIGDVKDEARVRAVHSHYRPTVVFHAAAYKHVPLMEERNAWEAVRNNVLGTYRMARAALEFDVRSFILISTDKAVNPTNVMGATKRAAELVCQVLRGDAATRFVTVRFGNVLGSTGSVVPLFQRQLAAGGPLTVTHPEINRYFMTVREAVELVLQASALGARAQVPSGGKLLVLDMGAPVKIADLARRMIRLAGLKPDRDVQIVFTGLRPGEKIEEELFHAAEINLFLFQNF